MTPNSSRIRRRAAGFSMVEVALALLILSIGVLTMVGLMSGGLDMSKTAMDYTQTSIFASDTLDGVRNFALNGTPTNGTVKFWSSLQSGLQLSAVAAGAFDKDTQTQIPIKNTTSYLNFFYSYETNVDFACRYRLSIEQYKDFTSSAALPGNLADQVASVKLDVINGLFGAAATQSFYTEIFQFVR